MRRIKHKKAMIKKELETKEGETTYDTTDLDLEKEQTFTNLRSIRKCETCNQNLMLAIREQKIIETCPKCDENEEVS